MNRSYLISAGFLVAVAGYAVLTRAQVDSGLWVVLVGATLMASGLVVVMSLSTELVMGDAPPERAGSASALLETASELGGALGIAILGSIGTAVYRSDRSGTPAGIPSGALDAARETLGGAAAAAGQLPGATGEAVLTAARHAFTNGMHVAAIAAAVVMAAAAVVAVAMLRSAPGVVTSTEDGMATGVPEGGQIAVG